MINEATINVIVDTLITKDIRKTYKDNLSRKFEDIPKIVEPIMRKEFGDGFTEDLKNLVKEFVKKNLENFEVDL